MNFKKHIEEDKLELQIAPLIDVVFLLLIYFMVTAALIKKEGDISFMLPGPPSQNQPIDIPVEVLIQISANGSVEVEGLHFSHDDQNLSDMVSHLKSLQEIAASQQSPFYVNILPNQDSLHRRVIDVMDACAAAGVKNLSFSKAL